MSEQLKNAKESLERIVGYDLKGISREKELGEKLSFKLAIDPIKRVISVFKQLSIDHLGELADAQLQIIQQQADAFYNLVESIRTFDADGTGTPSIRDQLITNIVSNRQKVFTALFPFISYLTVRMTDFSKLESDARAAVQATKDEANKTAETLVEHEKQAKNILESVQKVAAEQGVSQQAVYYKGEADEHKKQASIWGNRTMYAAIVLGLFAVFSLYLHKWPWLGLMPENTYDAIQLGLSKILIFGVISYAMILCARNFLNHTHNAIVNRHRQNALLTFTSLADAAGQESNQDIILAQAAECIFAPQDTGYIKQSSNITSGSTQAVARSLPRIVGQGVSEN